MTVYDRWHKSRPGPGEPVCAEHGKPPTADHGRGERWQARWRDETGRQCKQNFSRKADADTREAEVRISIPAGTYVDSAAGKVRFRDFAQQWRAMQVHRESTTVMIERALRLRINPLIGDLQLRAVRRGHIQQLVRQLAAELAPHTVTVEYGFVAAIFSAAVADRLIARTPCDGVRLPPEPRHETWMPEPAMVTALAASLAARYRAIPLTAAQTGLRPSEVMGLEVESVDFLRRTVTVRQQLLATTSGNVPYLAPPKTPQSERIVPVTADTIDMLAAYLAEFPAVAVQLEDRLRPAAPVVREARLLFTTTQDRPITRATWTGIWTPAARKAGFPERAGLHSCRHLYASALIRFGESAKTVQKLLGHGSARVTLDVYSHLWPDSADRARQAVAAAWADTAKARESDHG